MKKLLYLHGFLSGPESAKSQQLAAIFAELGQSERLFAPQLPAEPQAVMQLLTTWLAEQDLTQLVVMGSSLGGFFATVVAERYDLPAVLINPAVRPHQLAHHFLGTHRYYYSAQEVTVTPEMIEALAALEPKSIHPQRYWLMLASGDETLDAQQALAYYRGCRRLDYVEGGDHSFSCFPQYLPAVLEFLRGP